MNKYTLIDLDQMEASIVRRRLSKQPIAPLIAALQQRQCLSNLQITEPRYETNVYPLYYYWAHHRSLKHGQVYDRVFRSLPTHTAAIPEEQLRPHVARVVNTEIDILVEDIQYFLFIEAKEPTRGQKVKFENKGGVHQLVRQYVQGRILEPLTSKTFAFATIGANNGDVTKIELNDTERALLHLVGEERQSLEVVDLSWPVIMAGAQIRA